TRCLCLFGRITSAESARSLVAAVVPFSFAIPHSGTEVRRMTELKLSQSEVTTPESIRRNHRKEDRRVFAAGGLATAVIVGLLITLLFDFGGCSRKREATSSSNQNSSNQMASSSALPAANTSASVAPTEPAKKPAKLRPSTLTYKDSSYGVSFRY